MASPSRSASIVSTPRARAARRCSRALVALTAVGAIWAAASPSPSSGAATPAAARRAVQPAAGRILVAAPQLLDPSFARTVVLLTHHDRDGSLGVVINRPTTTALREVVPWVGDFEDRDDRLFLGGPVEQDHLLLLLRRSEAPPDSDRVFGDVWASGSLDTLRFVMEKRVPSTDLRAMAGYAGWGSGQLRAELERGDWYVLHGHDDLVFDADPATLWQVLVERARLPVA
jgi:putative transcriptional regulator